MTVAGCETFLNHAWGDHNLSANQEPGENSKRVMIGHEIRTLINTLKDMHETLLETKPDYESEEEWFYKEGSPGPPVHIPLPPSVDETLARRFRPSMAIIHEIVFWGYKHRHPYSWIAKIPELEPMVEKLKARLFEWMMTYYLVVSP